MNWALRNFKIHICLIDKDCEILNVLYRLYFTKVCEGGGIFDKNSFIQERNWMSSRIFCWGLREKYNFLENTRYSFWSACSEFHREEPSSQDKPSLQKQYGLRSDSRKAVNRHVPDISAYCSVSNSTVRPVEPWDVFGSWK